MDTQLDPIEAVLAVIGVRPLISKQVEHFRKDQLDQAMKLPETIQSMVRKLVKDELIGTPLFETSYDDTLRDLFDDWRPEQLEAMVKAMSKWIPHLDIGLMAKAKDVLSYLQGIFPRSSVNTALMSTNVVPSDPVIYDFESVLEVLDEPLKVLALMQQGAITKRQIAAVRLVYPTLSKVIDEALIDIVSDRKAEKKSFELPPAAEIGVTKWFGKPAIDPKLSAQLKAIVPKPKDASPPVPSATSPKTSVLAKESMSSAERATYSGLK